MRFFIYPLRLGTEVERVQKEMVAKLGEWERMQG